MKTARALGRFHKSLVYVLEHTHLIKPPWPKPVTEGGHLLSAISHFLILGQAALWSYKAGGATLRLIDISLDALIAGGSSTATDNQLQNGLQGGGHDPRKRGFTVQNVELTEASMPSCCGAFTRAGLLGCAASMPVGVGAIFLSTPSLRPPRSSAATPTPSGIIGPGFHLCWSSIPPNSPACGCNTTATGPLICPAVRHIRFGQGWNSSMARTRPINIEQRRLQWPESL